MWSSKARKLRPLLAAAVLALVVSPVAIAGAKGPSGTASALTPLKQLRALKKQTTVLKKQTAVLVHQAAGMVSEVAALQAKVAALEGRKQPPSTPSGPAGGDLTGSYPNPQIRSSTILSSDILDGTITGNDIAGNTISSTNILDNTIGSADIANGTIGQADLANGIVGGPQLAGVTMRESSSPVGGNNATGNESATCPAGTRLIGGGAKWEGSANGLAITTSMPDSLNPSTTWFVTGHNDSGNVRMLTAVAVCLV